MARRIGITLRDVEGDVITDEVRVEFRTPQKKLTGEIPIRFRGQRRVVELDVSGIEWPIFCNVTPSDYRGRRSPLSGFEEQSEIDVTLFRRSGKWKADYDAWSSLAADRDRFGPLVDVLTGSPDLALQFENSQRHLGEFIEDRYDESRTLAKAAMLNIFKKMTLTRDLEDRPWFRHVRELLVIEQERIIALVDPEMFEMARTIRDDVGEHPDYEKGTTGLHLDNIPERFAYVDDTSIKSTDDFANLQLSLFKVVEKDDTAVEHCVLDADIDENGNLARHLIDVFFIHPITGGTHPYDIHEFLTRRYPEVPLGYHLVPVGT